MLLFASGRVLMQIKWSARMTRDTFSRAMNLAFVAFVAFVL